MSLEFELTSGGLGLLSRLNADVAAEAAPVLKLHDARDHCIQRIILALPDVFAGLVLGAALPDEDRARIDELSAEALDAQPLPVSIAAVC